MREVIVEVRDGAAEVVTVPPGVKVTMRDFDIDGVDLDRLETVDGEQCLEATYYQALHVLGRTTEVS